MLSNRINPNSSSIDTKQVNNTLRTFHDLKELIEELRSWRDEHDGQPPPGASKTWSAKESDTAIRRAKIGREPVQTRRVQIDDEYVGWVLKRRDGTRVVVKSYGGNLQGWLGGDRGFSNEVISLMRGDKFPSLRTTSLKAKHNDHRRSAKELIDYRERLTIEGNEHRLEPLSFDTQQICSDALDRRINVPYDLRQSKCL